MATEQIDLEGEPRHLRHGPVDTGGELYVVGYDSAVGYEPTDEEEQADRISDTTLIRLSTRIPSIPKFVESLDVSTVERRLFAVIESLDESVPDSGTSSQDASNT